MSFLLYAFICPLCHKFRSTSGRHIVPSTNAYSTRTHHPAHREICQGQAILQLQFSWRNRTAFSPPLTTKPVFHVNLLRHHFHLASHRIVTTVPASMASSSELYHVQGVWDRMKGNSPIYDFLLSDVALISATKGSVTARLTLGKNHVNSRGTIHGAMSAALVDWSGGLAIATNGLEKTGASIDIHVTYIGTAQLGEIIEIEAMCNKLGRSMAFTTIRICKLVDGQPGPLVATASHTKYISQPEQ